MSEPIEVSISYSFDIGAAAPNECLATASYKGTEVKSYGGTWAEAKTNVLSRVGQILSAGEPPADEVVEMTPAG